MGDNSKIEQTPHSANEEKPVRFWVVRMTEAEIAKRQTLGEFSELEDAELCAQGEVVKGFLFGDLAPVMIWDTLLHQKASVWGLGLYPSLLSI